MPAHPAARQYPSPPLATVCSQARATVSQWIPPSASPARSQTWPLRPQLARQARWRRPSGRLASRRRLIRRTSKVATLFTRQLAISNQMGQDVWPSYIHRYQHDHRCHAPLRQSERLSSHSPNAAGGRTTQSTQCHSTPTYSIQSQT